ncbi:MAG: phosphoribosyltransferase family protein [Flavobacteriaceae bacterium]|nr:phosphoribosyltransferase family protein [Flavobacteriaceae bacterium]
MTSKGSIILNQQQIEHIITRIAYQIYEVNVNEKEVILAGIVGGGLDFAKEIQARLTEVSDLKVHLCELEINKQAPLKHPIQTTIPKEECAHKSLVLVDDVLNSGKTLIYGVNHFLDVPLKQFKTAVLVNRNHKKFPVKADFKGISLSTSLQEHIGVSVTAIKKEARLY